MTSRDRALPLTLLLGVLACTVDSEDGATSLGDPTASTTLPTTSVSTTAASTTVAGSESSSDTSDEDSSGAEATTASDPTEGSESSPSDSSGGVDEQPASGMYAACEENAECFGTQGCALVMPTLGFCTDGSCVEASACDPSPGGTATPACVATTFNMAATQVCALDCSGGKTCPGGMECLALDAAMVCV